MNLINVGDFTLHSGVKSDWKIDCDALTDEDLRAIAAIAARRLPPFGDVIGVPSGGLRLANALREHATRGPLGRLVVDDVYTTGRSMREHRRSTDVGFAIFARCPPSDIPPWLRVMFHTEMGFNEC